MNPPGGGGPAVIELGGQWREPLPDAPAPRGLLRGLAAVLAAALALALGGAAPRPVHLVEVAQVTGVDAFNTEFVFAGGAVLLRQPGRLTAYELRDGSTRWSLPLAASSSGPAQIMASAAVPELLVVGQLSDSGAAAGLVVDMATGQVRWRSGVMLEPVGDVARTLGSIYAATGAPLVRVYDLRTGNLRWTLPDAANVSFDGVSQTVVTVTAGGLATIRDVHDGRVLRRGELSLPRGSRIDGVFHTGAAFGVQHSTGDTGTVTAFDLATLRPVPDQDRADVDCGSRYRCVVAGGPTGDVEVVDRGTGSVVWRFPQHAFMIDERLLYVGGTDQEGLTGGYFGLRPLALIDLVTGRQTGVEGWEVMRQQPVPGTALLLRPVADGEAMQFARTGPGGVEVLAQLPGRVRRCAFEARTLLCTRDGNVLTFWRLLD